MLGSVRGASSNRRPYRDSKRKATTTLPPFYVKDYEARRIPMPKHTIDLLAEWQTQAPEGVPYILLTKDRFNRIKAKWQKL